MRVKDRNSLGEFRDLDDTVDYGMGSDDDQVVFLGVAGAVRFLQRPDTFQVQEAYVAEIDNDVAVPTNGFLKTAPKTVHGRKVDFPLHTNEESVPDFLGFGREVDTRKHPSTPPHAPQQGLREVRDVYLKASRAPHNDESWPGQH